MDVAAGLVGLLIVGTLAISAVPGSSSGLPSEAVTQWVRVAVAGAVILLLLLAVLGSGSRGGSTSA